MCGITSTGSDPSGAWINSVFKTPNKQRTTKQVWTAALLLQENLIWQLKLGLSGNNRVQNKNPLLCLTAKGGEKKGGGAEYIKKGLFKKTLRGIRRAKWLDRGYLELLRGKLRRNAFHVSKNSVKSVQTRKMRREALARYVWERSRAAQNGVWGTAGNRHQN